MEIIDGLILSDGGLHKRGCNTPILYLCVTTKEWTSLVQNELPFIFGEYIYKAHTTFINNTPVNHKVSYHLRTVDRALIPIYERWYANGKKIVPQDIILTPLSTLHWFYGDGCTSYINKCRSISVKLATNGFTKQEVELLQHRLYVDANVKMHINRQPNSKELRGYVLGVTKRSEYLNFFDFIGPCTVKGFEYKFKAHNNV
jgi:hypothetical protein